jgi:AcrR family transcriptional regulator
VTSSTAITGALSLREKQKRRTRRVLREAALKLFATQGYDATTIDEIAEKVGVAARTLFRYFPTKESLLFLGENDWMQSFADDYPRQPGELSDLDAMCATIVSQTPRLVQRQQSLLLFIRAIASSPTLRGLEQDRHQENIAKLAAAVATRRGLPRGDETCWLIAAVGLTCYRRALYAWLAGASPDLGQAVVDEFALLAEQISAR